MTEKYFFDTDCLSAFLWVREESVLAKLYSGRIILPAQVYNELKKVPHEPFQVYTELIRSGIADRKTATVQSTRLESINYEECL